MYVCEHIKYKSTLQTLCIDFYLLCSQVYCQEVKLWYRLYSICFLLYQWQGLPGGPGSPGPAGAKGATGLHGPDGTPGDEGSKGSVGAPGERGSQGMQGESGDAGAPGMFGALGEDGDDGPDVSWWWPHTSQMTLSLTLTENHALVLCNTGWWRSSRYHWTSRNNRTTGESV